MEGQAVARTSSAGQRQGRLPIGARAGQKGWAIEQHPFVRQVVQTLSGRLVLWAMFALAAWVGDVSLTYVLAAAAFAHAPAWRGWIALGAASVALARSGDKWLAWLAPVVSQEGLGDGIGRALVLCTLAVYLALAGLALAWTRRQPAWLLARRPVQTQLGLVMLMAVLASLPGVAGALRLVLWAWLCMAGTFMWFLAYALQDQRSRTPGPLPLQLGLLHPIWHAGMGALSPTPFGKGAAFLRKHQSRTPEELAVTQIKALKLMLWALVLGVLNHGLVRLAAWLGIPPTAEAYAAFQTGQAYALYTNWASLVVGAAGAALGLAMVGHKIIAVARLAGFRLPRNTWRPLQARTLAEFWNRYYYYFKELLVDFFFFPTFLRVFKRHPRLRVFLATFMAAGVGNAIYHFVRDIHLVPSMGWQAATVSYLPNLFYCTVLALGIGVSQARTTGGRQLSDGWAARLWSVLCVWGFFVVLQVFGDESRSFAFGDRVGFFLSLFGVR